MIDTPRTDDLAASIYPYTKIGLIRVILDLADDDLMMLDEKNLSSEESNQILKARKRIEKAIRILTTNPPSPAHEYVNTITGANGIKFSYRRDENAYLAKYVGYDDHYGAEQLKGGSWVPVVYQDDGWHADYVDGVYGEFTQATQAAWDYLS